MKSRLEQVFQFWERQDANIDSMFIKNQADIFASTEQNEIISYLPNFRGKRVLELASGIGRFTRYFSEHACHLTSVDLIQKFVDKNRTDHSDCSNITWICSDVMNLDFAPDSFDFIFFNWLFLYLTDSEAQTLIQKIHSWLSAQGGLFFRETCSPTPCRHPSKHYYAMYRPYSFYETLASGRFKILNNGHITTYVDYFSSPFHEFWHLKKN